MVEKTIDELVLELAQASKKIAGLEAHALELNNLRDELAQSESKYRTAFESTGTAMLLLDEDMTVNLINSKTHEFFGVPRDAVEKKRKWTDFIVSQDVDRLKRYHQDRRKESNAAPTEYEFKLRDGSGQIRDVLATVSMLPGSMQSLVSVIDITKRKEIEHALRESEQKFKDTAELTPAYIVELDTSLKVCYMNQWGLSAIGYTLDELQAGKINANDLIFDEDRQLVAHDIKNIFHGDYGNPKVYRFFKKDRTVFWVLINSSPIMRNGVIVGIRTCAVDISERIAAEKKMKESEERFRTIYQQSPIGIALYSPQGLLFDMNASFKGMFRLSEGWEEAPVSHLFSMVDLSDKNRSELEAGKSINRESEFINNQDGCATKDRRWFDWHVTTLGVNASGSTGYLVQVEDITERKTAQDAVLQKQIDATLKAEALIEDLKGELLEKMRFHNMVSRSPEMKAIFDLLPEIAVATAPVLINGESGTGKELVACSLHDLSNRSKKPFVAINCGALPDNLLESELFGYKAGAFTDAKKDKPGKFAAAEGGTIFFDEIGDISPAMQVKLLRVLQERIYEPLGSTTPVRTDVRVITATNKDLADMVKKGTFREDLFYRINVVGIKLPPLRERRADIPLLCDYFIDRFNGRYGKKVKGINKEVQDALMAHDFPGNIRELENAIEHAFIFCKGDLIERQHLPSSLRLANSIEQSETLSAVSGFDDLERMYLAAVLKETGGSRVQAAERLGIHKATLFRKLKKLGING